MAEFVQFCWSYNERYLREDVTFSHSQVPRSAWRAISLQLSAHQHNYQNSAMRVSEFTTVIKYRPKYAVVPDLSDQGVSSADIERAMKQYDQISQYCQIPLIVPKLPSQITLLPADVAIGYSVPSSYGGAKYDLWELAGRRVHLLGGSPGDQMEVFRQLASRAEVMSADGNMAMGAARNWAQYWDGGWVDHPEKGSTDNSLYLECWRKSCENIRREWETLVDLQPVLVQRSLFGGAL